MRIIGIIVDGKTIVGYVLFNRNATMTEDLFQTFEANQVKFLVKANGGIENAIVNAKNEIEITENSIERLPKYDSKTSLLLNNTKSVFVVLCEKLISTNSDIVNYNVVLLGDSLSKLKAQRLEESQLLEFLSEKKYVAVNAKTVEKNGTVVLQGIKKPINTVEVPNTPKPTSPKKTVENPVGITYFGTKENFITVCKNMINLHNLIIYKLESTKKPIPTLRVYLGNYTLEELRNKSYKLTDFDILWDELNTISTNAFEYVDETTDGVNLVEFYSEIQGIKTNNDSLCIRFSLQNHYYVNNCIEATYAISYYNKQDKASEQFKHLINDFFYNNLYFHTEYYDSWYNKIKNKQIPYLNDIPEFK